jgi:hypothetical protein
MPEFGLAMICSGIITAIGAALASATGDPDIAVSGFFGAAGVLVCLGAGACITPMFPAKLPRVAGANAHPTTRSDHTPLPPSWGWFGLIVVSYISLVAASAVFYGTPKKLPGIALGASALLQMERGAAGLAAIAIVCIFAYLTRLGQLPTQIANVASYPDTTAAVDLEQEVARRVAERTENLERRIFLLEEAAKSAIPSDRLVAQIFAEHDRRLDELERGSHHRKLES